MQNLKRELELVFPSLGEELHPPPRAPPSSHSMARVGSPSHHALAGAATLTAALGQQVAPPHHGHRRGVSVSGSGIIPNIPNAMSIGDIHSLVPPNAHGNTAAGADSTTETSAAGGMNTRDRSKSIDQLGLTLEGLDGVGVRKDSFSFNPFGQATRFPSIHKQISGSKLIPPASAAATALPNPPPPTKLETIPGGVRVTDAKPHPKGAAPPPLTSEPPGAPPSSAAAPSPPTQHAPAPHATTVVIPQLLLITRNGPAKNKEQEDALEVDITRPSDLARVKSWLHGNSPQDRLDGLYMQYQPCMLEPEGIEAMRALSDQYSIGM